jgi:hypothetical protein
MGPGTATLDAVSKVIGPMFCVNPNGDMAEVLIRALVIEAPAKLNVKGPVSVFPLSMNEPNNDAPLKN